MGSDRGGLLALVRGLGRGLLRVPRAWSWLPIGAWAFLIHWISSRDLSGVRLGGRGYVGNLAHAAEFGLLTLWCLLALPRAQGWVRLERRGRWLIGTCVVLYGLLDELHQSTIPGRDASLADLLTDATGMACVLWIAGYAGRPQATRSGMGARFLACLALCLAVALASTVVMWNTSDASWW